VLRRLLHELKHHVPFTLGGTVVGAAIMAAMSWAHVDHEVSETLFVIVHPAHVLLSAVATAGMYRLHGKGQWWATLAIGFVGSIGIATLSDSVIPYAGEILLGLEHAHVHAGFLEEWYLVCPLAVAGSVVAYMRPRTTFPHAGHVLLSTWASLMHMTAAMGGGASPGAIAALAAFLFLAVWIPCCASDIVFPLLFVPRRDWPACGCGRGGDNPPSPPPAAC